jgi:hypothetical protein
LSAAAALAEQHIARWNSDIFENNLGMAMRGLVIAEDRQHPFDKHAGVRRGTRIIDFQRYRSRVVGIRLAHHDHDLARRFFPLIKKGVWPDLTEALRIVGDRRRR